MPNLAGDACLSQREASDDRRTRDVEQMWENALVGREVVARQCAAIARRRVTVHGDQCEALVGSAIAHTRERGRGELTVAITPGRELSLPEQMHLAHREHGRTAPRDMAAGE